MSGTKYLFDTNTLINFLQGNAKLKEYSHVQASISIITFIEFLSFPKITSEDKILFKELIRTLQIVDLKHDDVSLIEKIIEIRSNAKIKLPDAIIAASAISIGAVLVTNDKDFSKVDSLLIKSY